MADIVVSSAFDTLSNSLATLLFYSDDALSSALNTKQAEFVRALKAMKEDGELPWLPVPSSMAAEATTNFVPTTAAEKWPPELPPIRNPQLKQQAFTHSSFILGESASMPGVENVHYERLEFLGDAYLQSISSHLLFTRFPKFREGQLSEMRQQLVSNQPLAEFARLYDMDNQIRQGRGQEVHKSQPKIVADCFEAYIGAIVLDADTIDEGVQMAREWLKALFEPKIQDMELQRKTLVPVDKMAKQTLNAVAGGNRAKIEYRWTGGAGGNKGGFWVSVFLNGWGFEDKYLGKGWGSSKSDAELRAAMNVLADEELCKEIKEAKSRILGPRPTPGSRPPRGREKKEVKASSKI
ncbi:ribonuclease III domain-containing protein [Sphaerosporella brunnea]|uniref:ribonuclease III n=1 Tax=Sphaerosporella brunnea TaxID=1250544 RepID=A0A5J5F8M8_9PEZI|nr:ribonuclease III domain-containing protein [Sphaerosporella brunnea]